MLLGDLRAQAIHLVVIAGDANEARAVNLRGQNFRRLDIGGNENPGLKAAARGLRGDGVGEIAGGGATDDFEAELARGAEGHGDYAIFERKRGETDGVVLDVKMVRAEAAAQAARGHQRREADGQRGGFVFDDRQQVAITPNAIGASFDRVAREILADRGVVVGDFERRETLFAE